MWARCWRDLRCVRPHRQGGCAGLGLFTPPSTNATESFSPESTRSSLSAPPRGLRRDVILDRMQTDHEEAAHAVSDVRGLRDLLPPLRLGRAG